MGSAILSRGSAVRRRGVALLGVIVNHIAHPATTPTLKNAGLTTTARNSKMNSADEAHREWMRKQLDCAAEHFSLTLAGDQVFGWRNRTIGSRTNNDRWLRVSWSQERWTDRDWWTGNEEAATISGVPKPTVLDLYDWKVIDDEWGECRNRAEVMTLVAAKPCSETQELQGELDLPSHWWTGLRNALDALAEHHTERGDVTQEDVTNRLLLDAGHLPGAEPMCQQRRIPSGPDLQYPLAAVNVQVSEHQRDHARHTRRTGDDLAPSLGTNRVTIVNLRDDKIVPSRKL